MLLPTVFLMTAYIILDEIEPSGVHLTGSKGAATDSTPYRKVSLFIEVKLGRQYRRGVETEQGKYLKERLLLQQVHGASRSCRNL